MSQALLEALDGSGSYTFLVNPEVVQEDYRASFSKIAIIGTGQPLQQYQHSEDSLSLPGCKLWIRGNNTDVSEYLSTLKLWTKPDSETLEPKVLRFTWGDIVMDRCYLERLSVRVQQVRSIGGNTAVRPTMAIVDISLVPAPEPLEPLVDDSPIQELSLRDRNQLAVKVAASLGQEVAIDATGNVTAIGSGEALGTIQEILGDDLPPEYANVGSPSLPSVGSDDP